MKLINSFLILACLMASCGHKQDVGFDSAAVTNKQDVIYRALSLDPICLDSINTSSYGESDILPEGRIAFIDNNFCTVSIFDTLGHCLKTTLGQGGGPNETQVGRISGHVCFENGDLGLLGYNLDFHIFDKDYALKEIFMIPRTKTDSIETSSFTYSNQYTDMVCRSYKRKVYYNIYAEHPDFNMLYQTDKYLKKCYHIWEVNVGEKKEGRLLAQGYPKSYQESPYTHMIFLGTTFDIDKQGNFYVNYDTDSLVYVYDNDFRPLHTYGYAGKGMNTNYLSIHDVKECRKNYRSERNTKGWYYWLEYVDETNTLFRSYQKDSETTDGLQIYKDGCLVGDVEVPKRFRVMGYIAPYYYSYIIPNMEEDDNSLVIYRFKL